MAPTLAELLAVRGLGLRVVAGAGPDSATLRRPVTWVAVSELADPTPYLEGGELLLLTGLRGELAADADRYVRRLVAARAAALGFGVGVVHPKVPHELVAAADAAGLPLLEVDRPTPFVAVSKAVADLLATEQSDRTRRRLDGMRDLTAGLAGDADRAVTLRRLATHVDGWAALLDARARVAAVAGRRPRPEVARRLADQLRARSGARGHASAADADAAGRVTVLPLGLRERPLGYLAVGVGPDTDLDHHLVAFAASLLTLDAEHLRGTRPVRRWARAAALAARVGLTAPVAPAAVDGPASGGEPVRALVVDRPLDVALDALDDEDVASGLPVEGGCLLVVTDADAEEVLAALGTCRGGLSDPVAAAELTTAVRAARSLAARSGALERPTVLRADATPPSVIDLLGAPVAVAFADSALAPLRAVPDGGVLEETLRAYLECGGLALAADRLGVHRHTLRSRLRRIGDVLRRNLDDATVRAELWLALSVRNTGP
jgi:purine catabolism regulator